MSPPKFESRVQWKKWCQCKVWEGRHLRTYVKILRDLRVPKRVFGKPRDARLPISGGGSPECSQSQGTINRQRYMFNVKVREAGGRVTSLSRPSPGDGLPKCRFPEPSLIRCKGGSRYFGAGSFRVRSIKFRLFWRWPLSIWLKFDILLFVVVTPYKSASHTHFQHPVSSNVG